MNRRALLASLAASPLLAARFSLAQRPARIRRLGMFLGDDDCKPPIDDAGNVALLKALTEVVEAQGGRFSPEWRCFGMDPERGARMAAELVRMPVDVIFTQGTPQTRILQEATKTVPIVSMVLDPVASGFAKSLGRPGGNITGLCWLHPESYGKFVEVIRKAVPRMDRLVIVDDAAYVGGRELLGGYEAAGRAAGLPTEVRIVDLAKLEDVFIDIKRAGAPVALLVFAEVRMPGVAAKLALRHGVPTMYNDRGYVEHGGLMSFTMYHENLDKRLVVMLGKILGGANPANIPWELPDRSHLAINLRTAKALGLAIPQELLLRADQVIE